MKKINKIPQFKNYQEEANFWDTHDFTDFFDESKKVKLVVNLKTPKDQTLTVRLQPDLKIRLNLLAQDMGTQPSTLARMWLMEKLKSLHAI